MKKDPTFSYITVDGMENCLEAIGEIEKGNLKNCFIEMSACPGSCINGPSIRRHKHSVLSSKMRTENYASGHAEHISYEKDYNIKTQIDLKKHIRDDRIRTVMPGEAQIKEILLKMGKTKKEDELNCGTCGYATCRDKAVAVYSVSYTHLVSRFLVTAASIVKSCGLMFVLFIAASCSGRSPI